MTTAPKSASTAQNPVSSVSGAPTTAAPEPTPTVLAKKAVTAKTRAVKKIVAVKTTTPVAAVAKPPVVKAKPAAIAQPAKAKKPKLVRDSFTIPKPEYAVLDTLKLRANTLAQPAKKSELLRAGIKALAAMSDAALLAALLAVPAIKTGRPATAAKPVAKKVVKKA
jgi:hypothetical protein